MKKKSVAKPSRADNQATGEFAHAEGFQTHALTRAAHTEGIQTQAADEPAYGKAAHAAHCEGVNTRASGWEAHVEGGNCWAEALIAHAQNCVTLAAGNDSHAEGVQTVTGRRRYFINPEDQGLDLLDGVGARPFFIVRADPDLNPAGDYTREFIDQPLVLKYFMRTTAVETYPAGFNRHNTVILFSTAENRPEKFTVLRSIHARSDCRTKVYYDHPGEAFPLPDRIMLACASYAPEGELDNPAYNDGKGQHAEGKRTNAAANFAHAEGRDTTCFGRYSHAEGYLTKVTGNYGAHAEGEATLASGIHAHAEGAGTAAAGNAAHAEGGENVAAGDYAHAGGLKTAAAGDCSVAGGRHTQAGQAGAQIMGQYGAADTAWAWHLAGGSPAAPVLKARIDARGAHHSGPWQSGGCGYAEMFEWADGNPGAEDRAGLFVTLQDDKIRETGSPDDYLLGIVAAAPAAVGDAAALSWPGRERRDAMGRVMLAGCDEYGCPRDRINPDYDALRAYASRTQRREWSPVALIGKQPVRDNGECRVGGYCRPGAGGRAVPAPQGYRVIRRLAEQVIQIVLK